MTRNNNKKTIASFAGLAVLIMIGTMFFPMAAAAAGQHGGQHVTNGNKVDANRSQEQIEIAKQNLKNAQNQFRITKDRLEDAQDIFHDSRNRFMQQKEKFAGARTTQNGNDLKHATKDYLNTTIEYTIIRLESLIDKAETAEENGNAPFTSTELFEGYIDDLEDLKSEVEIAETNEDFQAITIEIRDIWQHIYLESKYFLMGSAHNKGGSFLERSEGISQRIEAEINELDEAGEDTDKLNGLLDDYNDALNEANMNRNRVTNRFENHDGFNNNGELSDPKAARQFLRDINRYMNQEHHSLREANSALRMIFAELKEHRPGVLNLCGTESVEADGDGRAALSGDLTINLSADSGVLTITDFSGDARINVTGYGTKKEIGFDTVIYNGTDGSAQISGSSITVVIKGEGIELFAEGTGSAILCGYGTYTVYPEDGESITGEWATPVYTDEDETVKATE